jgi:UDP-N-acetylglucosamine enolpyruvyl transferase
VSRFVIQGGRKISGTHRVSGNKNAALPMIAASLLTSEPVTLCNVPDIADVAALAQHGHEGAVVAQLQREGAQLVHIGVQLPALKLQHAPHGRGLVAQVGAALGQVAVEDQQRAQRRHRRADHQAQLGADAGAVAPAFDG